MKQAKILHFTVSEKLIKAVRCQAGFGLCFLHATKPGFQASRLIYTILYAYNCFTGIPYEIRTFTSDLRSAGTSANVHIQLYGREICTQEKPLCVSKTERDDKFKRGAEDLFVVEVNYILHILRMMMIIIIIIIIVITVRLSIPFDFNNKLTIF